ncbi:MAG: alpha-amylase family glycosyl hydrolase [Rhodothermaceae bacterium]
MQKKPVIFEINSRVWIKRFNNISNILDIPTDYWQSLRNKGIDYIWLMGLWETVPESVEKYCFAEELLSGYNRALPDWKKEDVIGSAYAINQYKINPLFGSEQDITKLKEILNNLGLKLILDFIPNHFNSLSVVVQSNPEIFLTSDEERFENDPITYFKVNGNNSVFAHGRDPFFPAWQDTIQINYYKQDARDFMLGQLTKISKMCDGVRCDMAILSLNNIFQNTWGNCLNDNGYQKPETEFWEDAISSVKTKQPDFIFIAEAYWNLEWQLQQLGFDFTYDKKLTDRLQSSHAKEIREHLLAEEDYQNKSLRFLENHDEERALSNFGTDKSKAAAVIISTIPGMKLFHDGQFEGKKIKLPVQLGREPDEKPNPELLGFYNKLLEVSNSDIIKQGKWNLLETIPVWENHNMLSFKSILAWELSHQNKRCLVAVNYDEGVNSCRIKIDVNSDKNLIDFDDVINNNIYIREIDEIKNQGLFVELQPYHYHILVY